MVEAGLNPSFDVIGGLLGIQRDICFGLINLMFFKDYEDIKNLLGISGDCVEWIKHPLFFWIRKPRTEVNIKKQRLRIKNTDLEETGLVGISPSTITFKLYKTETRGSIFLNVLVRNVILESVVKVEFHSEDKDPWMSIGISTLAQLEQTKLLCIGENNTELGSGACLHLRPYSSSIGCNGKWTPPLKEGGWKDGEKIIALINNVRPKSDGEDEKKVSGGKMNFFRDGKKIPYTIINVPSIGVYLGFSTQKDSVIVHIISLCKMCVPPPALAEYSGMKCVGYDFNGSHDDYTYKIKDEEGNEIPNHQDYFK